MLITAELERGGGAQVMQNVIVTMQGEHGRTAKERLTDFPRSDRCCGARGGEGRRSYVTMLTMSQD